MNTLISDYNNYNLCEKESAIENTHNSRKDPAATTIASEDVNLFIIMTHTATAEKITTAK